QARAHRPYHLVAQQFDPLQRTTFAYRIEEPLIGFRKVGFDPHQEHGHSWNHRQVSQEHRNVVDHRSVQRTDDLLAGRRVVPEHQLVDPHTEVVEETDSHQAEVKVLAAEHLEGDEHAAGVGAVD